MSDFSEEKMLEISEKITAKFSKVRFATLHNVKNNEQGNHKDASITMRNGKDVYVQQELREHGGYHVVGSKEKELELLNPQNLDGNTAQNGNGHSITAELPEVNTQILPKLRASPLEDVQTAKQ